MRSGGMPKARKTRTKHPALPTEIESLRRTYYVDPPHRPLADKALKAVRREFSPREPARRIKWGGSGLERQNRAPEEVQTTPVDEHTDESAFGNNLESKQQSTEDVPAAGAYTSKEGGAR
jgi:hypothetical protein